MKTFMQFRLRGGQWLELKVRVANTFWTRLIGLMGSAPEEKMGLLLAPTQSIHTCFMRYNLDVVFLDKADKVLRTYRNMKPWRMTNFHWRAVKVIEVPAEELPNEIKPGQHLEFKHV